MSSVLRYSYFRGIFPSRSSTSPFHFFLLLLFFSTFFSSLTFSSRFRQFTPVVEVFEHALANTAGEDLAKILWLKSETSETWLQRRYIPCHVMLCYVILHLITPLFVVLCHVTRSFPFAPPPWTFLSSLYSTIRIIIFLKWLLCLNSLTFHLLSILYSYSLFYISSFSYLYLHRRFNLFVTLPYCYPYCHLRANYTRSLAVMSMVGYVLGLGDRHPSNLMLDRKSGKVLHIDFGDCFEVAMQREKFPERVPFRLTRMLVSWS